MPYVADLHIHSRFARACSRELNIPNLSKWAKYKGIDLMGTGDCLHPIWFTELKSVLKEGNGGVYSYQGVNFVLTTEVACIYSEGGKVHRIHLLIFFPSFESVQKLYSVLSKKANLSSDGRPILGLTSKQLCEMVFSSDPKSIIIPAHCILQGTLIHTPDGMKPIEGIKVGQLVYTHKNRRKKVTEVIKHQHRGMLYKVQPWYFSPGLEATSEHPFLAIKVKHCPSTGDRCLPTAAHQKLCKHKFYDGYKAQWIKSEDLEVGDFLVYPRFNNSTPISNLAFDETVGYHAKNGLVYSGGTRGHIFKQNTPVSEDLCRLAGYYLAEGWVTAKGEVGFCFNKQEASFINDVKNLIENVFGIKHSRIYQRPNVDSMELIFSSKLLVVWFSALFYSNNSYNAKNKTLPDWMLHLPTHLQAQLLLGWWRGDKGYTVSRQLMNQMKVICLRLGIVPSVGIDKAENHFKRGNHQYRNRVIKASTDLFYFSYLAFFEDKYNLLSDPSFAKCRRKISRRLGFIDSNYIYIPIRKISKRQYVGEVFNLEVEEDSSYLTEFAAVHNCWTPWFSLFGSNSGYDRLYDCFGQFSDQIYGIETGLSSEPAMNWRIADLDNKSIVSFSDAHSLPRLARESTIFGGEISKGFETLHSDIKNNNIVGTIEFFPEEGKYHYSGHRNCGVVYGPEELKKKGKVCPKCGRDLTVGVMQRVEDLASRSEEELKLKNVSGVVKSEAFPNRPGFRMLVQLEEIIAEAVGSVVTSQKVKNEYERLVTGLAPELMILTKTPLEEIKKFAGARIAEGIGRVREGKLKIEPGYDNTYGVVKIWDEEEEKKSKPEQATLF